MTPEDAELLRRSWVSDQQDQVPPARTCEDGQVCVNHCGTEPWPCSRKCQTCLRLAWTWTATAPCPACPDAPRKQGQLMITRNEPDWPGQLQDRVLIVRALVEKADTARRMTRWKKFQGGSQAAVARQRALRYMADECDRVAKQLCGTWGMQAPAPAARVVGVEAAGNPPHHATVTGEPVCATTNWQDSDSNYACTAQDGHDGPDHIAYNPAGGEYHRWPIADPAPTGMLWAERKDER
jgi:hypothetical protein